MKRVVIAPSSRISGSLPSHVPEIGNSKFMEPLFLMSLYTDLSTLDSQRVLPICILMDFL